MRRRIIVWLAALLAVGAARPAHAAEPGVLQIGFFCGPPRPHATSEEFRRIAAAGFTFALPPCDAMPTVSENRATLAAAAKTNVKVFVRDARIPASLSEPGATTRLDAVIADYADEPEFAGYALADEPTETAFAGLGQVVAYLRTHDPAHPAFINVLPNYGPHPAGYESYLERYAADAGTAMFSFDFYPFTIYGDRPEYLPNLDSLRTLSLRHARPFWQIGQATPHLAYRQPTEAEKQWQVFQALAYGASGISYFTYWSVAADGYGPGIIDPNGAPTAQYAEVQRINARAQAIGRYLVSARSTDVFQSPPVPGSLSPRRPGAAVDVDGDAPVTAGVFETDEHVYVMLANRRADASITTNADLSFGPTLPQALDPATGTWSTVRATVTGTAATTRVTLAAGDAKLFRAAKPVPAGSLGPAVIAYTTATTAAGQCPANYVDVWERAGRWLCARSDLTGRAFHVADGGRRYRVQNGSTVAVRRGGCPRAILESGDLRVCTDGAPQRAGVRARPARGCPSGFRLDGVGLCGRGDPIARILTVADSRDPCAYVASASSWMCVRAPRARAAAPPPAARQAG